MSSIEVEGMTTYNIIWKIYKFSKYLGINLHQNEINFTKVEIISKRFSTASVHWTMRLNTADEHGSQFYMIIKRETSFIGWLDMNYDVYICEGTNVFDTKSLFAIKSKNDNIRPGSVNHVINIMTMEELTKLCKSPGSFPGDQISIFLKLRLPAIKEVNERQLNQVIQTDSQVILHTPKLEVNYGVKAMLNNPKQSDVTIICQNEKIFAHKTILAFHSTVFEKMFQHKEMKENLDGILRLDDVDLPILKLVLEFVYTGTIYQMPNDDQSIVALLKYGDKYDLSGLINSCFKFMTSTLGLKNVGSYIVAVGTFHNKDDEYHKNVYASLKEFCKIKHSELLLQPEYRKLFVENVKLFIDF